MALPETDPRPVMTLTTPGGRTWAMSLASSSRLSEVSLEGLMTTQSPAARAGEIFQAAMSSGKFQGMICPTTPRGSRRMMLMVCSSIIVARPSSVRMAAAK